MSPPARETFEVSLPPVAPGLPPLVRERVRELGPGAVVTRADVRRVCATDAAANHFLDEATTQGLLVPTAWGEYRVPDERTLQALGRIANPAHRRLLAWTATLPKAWGGRVLFAGPRVWRDTELNLDDLLPVIPLDRVARSAEGAPPQWNAFLMDVTKVERWEIRLDGRTFSGFQAPSVLDVVVLLRASLDPRWRQAAGELEDDARLKPEAVNKIFTSLVLEPAPRGRTQRKALPPGPPHAHRLLYPKWYGGLVRSRLPRIAQLLDQGAERRERRGR